MAEFRDEWRRCLASVAECNAMIMGTMQANLDEIDALLAGQTIDADEVSEMVHRHRPQVRFLTSHFLEQHKLLDKLGIEFVDADQPQDAPA